MRSLGSGFVIDRRADIPTNDHAGANGRVGFSGGRSYPATIAGTDATTDLAVVRVDAPASTLHPLAFDDSASAGIVSARARHAGPQQPHDPERDPDPRADQPRQLRRSLLDDHGA